MDKKLIIYSVITGLLVFVFAGAAEKSRESELSRILTRFDEAQDNTESVKALFTQKKELALLEEPSRSAGTFYYVKPDSFLWEYSEPETAYLLLKEDLLTSYYPRLKSADKINIKRYKKKIMKYIGLGQSREKLSKTFDVSLEEGNSVSGTYLIKLDPSRKRVEKRLELVRMWIDAETYLPRKVEYIEINGDRTFFSFSNLEINKTIPDSKFRLEIPDDVKVSHTTDNLFPG